MYIFIRIFLELSISYIVYVFFSILGIVQRKETSNFLYFFFESCFLYLWTHKSAQYKLSEHSTIEFQDTYKKLVNIKIDIPFKFITQNISCAYYNVTTDIVLNCYAQKVTCSYCWAVQLLLAWSLTRVTCSAAWTNTLCGSKFS